MNRENFIKIIKLRSFWKIDRRKGDYQLPNGEKLHKYVTRLVESQMKIDNLGIRENGNLCQCTGGAWNTEKKAFDDYTLMPIAAECETCTYDEMEHRIHQLIAEIIG